VNDCVHKIRTFSRDIFNEDYHEEWNVVYSDFKQSIDQIEDETASLINQTFKEKLNSSDGAFNLLAKFKNIKTRPKIEQQMKNKYDDVLKKYKEELVEMNALFEKYKDNPPISKNMPPTAGRIEWARSIMGRVKGPIDKFKQKEGLIYTPLGQEATQMYINLVRKLDQQYE